MSLPVSGGSYARTYTSSADGGRSATANDATVSGLRLDKYLVTAGRFRASLKLGESPSTAERRELPSRATRGAATFPPNSPASTNASETGDAHELRPKHMDAECDLRRRPADDVHRRAEAYAFCIWDGFLLSEAEWQLAAGGGAAELQFPWGSTPPNLETGYAVYNCDYGPAPTCPTAANIAPVGNSFHGAALYGQYDMRADVQPWMVEWSAPYQPSDNGAYLSLYTGDGGPTQASHAMRGGWMNRLAIPLEPAYRQAQENSASPTARSGRIGVRCARPPLP